MGRRYPQLGDPAWLRQRYLVESLSFVEIARELGCSEFAVRGRWRRRAFRSGHERGDAGIDSSRIGPG
jgi:transposase-like protein